jgi:hypothetical protein
LVSAYWQVPQKKQSPQPPKGQPRTFGKAKWCACLLRLMQQDGLPFLQCQRAAA